MPSGSRLLGVCVHMRACVSLVFFSVLVRSARTCHVMFPLRIHVLYAMPPSHTLVQTYTRRPLIHADRQ